MRILCGEHSIRGEAHARVGTIKDEVEEAASHASVIAYGNDPVVVIVVVYAGMRSVGMHQCRYIKRGNPVLTGERNKLSIGSNLRGDRTRRPGPNPTHHLVANAHRY